MNKFLQLDDWAFYLINHLPHNNFLNGFALLIHYTTNGGLVYYPFVLSLYFLGNLQKKLFAKLFTIAAVSTFIITDLILKHLFLRSRPFQVLRNVIYIGTAPHNYSFPSGQSATAAVLATLYFLIFPNGYAKWFAFAFAIIVFVDRIYMGHHFPSDVAAGGLIGLIVTVLTVKYIKPLLLK